MSTHREYCELGKVRYHSDGAARRAIAEWRVSRSMRRKPRKVYRCELCHGYHVSSVRTTRGRDP